MISLMCSGIVVRMEYITILMRSQERKKNKKHIFMAKRKEQCSHVICGSIFVSTFCPSRNRLWTGADYLWLFDTSSPLTGALVRSSRSYLVLNFQESTYSETTAAKL
jgi:hypothetical protein